MHILLIHQAFAALDEPGGTRHYELARYLAQRGHRVTIIASPVSYLTGQTSPPPGPPHFLRKWGGLGWGARQIAHRAGDDRHPVPALGQETRQFVVTRPAGFVEGCKGLVDEEDVHKDQ